MRIQQTVTVTRDPKQRKKNIRKRSQQKNVNIPAHSMPNCLPDVRNLLEVEVQQAVALDPLVIFVLLLCSLRAHLQQMAVAVAATTAARLLPLHFAPIVVVIVVVHTRRKIEQRRPNWRRKFCRHRRFSTAERRRRRGLFHSTEDAAAVTTRRAIDARPLSTL